MGGSNSSPRKITIINDEQSGVIKVSDAVVRRLKGEPPKITKVAVHQQQPIENNEPQFTPSNKEFFVKQQSSGLPYEELYQQAMHLRRERDEQIRKIENRWRERVDAVERHNSVVETAMNDQYKSTVEDIHKILPKKACGSICEEHQNKVYECYKDNVTSSLNCSKEVRDFKNCVQHARLSAFNKG